MENVEAMLLFIEPYVSMHTMVALAGVSRHFQWCMQEYLGHLSEQQRSLYLNQETMRAATWLIMHCNVSSEEFAQYWSVAQRLVRQSSKQATQHLYIGSVLTWFIVGDKVCNLHTFATTVIDLILSDTTLEHVFSRPFRYIQHVHTGAVASCVGDVLNAMFWKQIASPGLESCRCPRHVPCTKYSIALDTPGPVVDWFVDTMRGSTFQALLVFPEECRYFVALHTILSDASTSIWPYLDSRACLFGQSGHDIAAIHTVKRNIVSMVRATLIPTPDP